MLQCERDCIKSEMLFIEKMSDLFSFLFFFFFLPCKTCFKVMMATLDTLLEDEENQIRGLTYVVDGKGDLVWLSCFEICFLSIPPSLRSGLSVGHWRLWTPSEARRLVATCQRNLAARHRDINLLHLPLPLHAIFSFVKYLLSSKLRCVCVWSQFGVTQPTSLARI